MAVAASDAADLRPFALAKMSAVLGPERARDIMDRLVRKLGTEPRTPQDLLRFADEMTALGGFEGAVGAMLGVAAVMRGAARPALDSAAASSRQPTNPAASPRTRD